MTSTSEIIKGPSNESRDFEVRARRSGDRLDGLAAAAPAVGEAQKQLINIHAIVMFFFFVI